MDDFLREKCDLLSSNWEVTRGVSAFDFRAAEMLMALLYTIEGKVADEKTIQAVKPLLKERASVFSAYRGIMETVLMAKASLQSDPGQYLDAVIEVTESLKKHALSSGNFLVMAALPIVDHCEPARVDEIVDRTKVLLKKMNDLHPVLTDSSDASVAALLSIYGADSDAVLEEAEENFQILKSRFKVTKDNAQAAAQILALSPKPAQEKCERFFALLDGLKEAGCNMHKGRQVAVLGAFADVDRGVDDIVELIAQTDEYLKTKKGFRGISGLQYELRRLLAAVLVLLDVEADAKGVAPGAAVGTAVSQVLAEQIVIEFFIIMFVVASTSANAAAASSAS